MNISVAKSGLLLFILRCSFFNNVKCLRSHLMRKKRFSTGVCSSVILNAISLPCGFTMNCGTMRISTLVQKDTTIMTRYVML